ncbi:hypothetical protein HNQ02_003295 [Flavobacterium sp. 7E]|uniref:hypothetical protein n=1 Tax=Flavobacterium sp. 7E TaxID=2735898 RepID=UPI00156E304F|nr:hypothetical protein [Flavobacterium sp. 7E]NRS90355.1 hypothetical protein [Flavobacterium sp. 7E]
MKKIALLILIFSVSYSISAQEIFYEYQLSSKYRLTTVDSNLLKKIELDSSLENEKATIFLIDTIGNKLKEFKVYPLQFKPKQGVSDVCEISQYEPKLVLKNINNIVKVQIVQCNGTCKYSIYYWLITNQNKWIELPMIEHDFGIEKEYKDYYFPYDVTNQIGVAKYKTIRAKAGETELITDVFQGHVRYLDWDGVTVSQQ